MDENGPREDFFCFIFTEDVDGEDVSYFFTAKDIVENLNLSKDGKVYYFKVLPERRYENFKNLKKNKILDAIEKGIDTVELSRNKDFIRQASFVFENATRHFDEEPNFEYLFKIQRQVKIVICENVNNGYAHLLETRRDLFHCHSSYGWGNYSSEVKLLAVSLLSHHLDGRHPPEKAIFSLIENKLALLDSGKEYTLTSKELEDCISKPLDYLDTIQRKELEHIKSINESAEFFVVLGRDKNIVKFQDKSSRTFTLEFPNDHFILSDVDRFLPMCRNSVDIINPNLLYAFAVERNSIDASIIFHDNIKISFYDN